MNSTFRQRLLPVGLTALAIILDQLTKALVVANIRVNTIASEFLGGLLRIVHQKNLGVAFSMGDGLPDMVRFTFFVIVPILILSALLAYHFVTKELTLLQHWMLCGIVGGGFGNLIDRVFRPDGVVDFISVKFYGLFGMQYFPTFNVADSFVVVCGILLGITLFIQDAKKKPAEKKA